MKTRSRWLGLLIIIITSTIIMPAPVQGQTVSYNRGNDIVVFGGINAQRLNLNSYGYFYGLYGDYLPVKSKNKRWTGGVFVMANRSWYLQNLEQYTGSGLQVATGITIGYYKENFSSKSQLFIGMNLGLMYSDTRGKSSTLRGDYHGQQKDEILYYNLNLNIIRTVRFLPRTQLLLTGETALIADSKAWWNEKPTNALIWDMGYYEALFKQSIYDIPLKNWSLTPKITGLFSYSLGNQEKDFGIGGEISLHRPHKDDFLSLYYLYKFSNINPDIFSTGIVINFGNSKKQIIK